MALFQFIETQEIRADIHEIWDFISSPLNLKKITPEYMGFVVTNKMAEQKMDPGMIITYKVSPVAGIKTTWVTEITKVKPFNYFVDEQRAGPYRMWHHEHFVDRTEGGTVMKDIVTYQPPFGIMGTLANRIFIHRKLSEIFAYRTRALEQIFGTMD